MMEVGIFRKELHEAQLVNLGAYDQIGKFAWIEIADGHEVVFNDSVESVGTMTIVNPVNGKMVELLVFRDWCNDFHPLM